MKRMGDSRNAESLRGRTNVLQRRASFRGWDEKVSNSRERKIRNLLVRLHRCQS